MSCCRGNPLGRGDEVENDGLRVDKEENDG